jgi:hypothetical protein
VDPSISSLAISLLTSLFLWDKGLNWQSACLLAALPVEEAGKRTGACMHKPWQVRLFCPVLPDGLAKKRPARELGCPVKKKIRLSSEQSPKQKARGFVEKESLKPEENFCHFHPRRQKCLTTAYPLETGRKTAYQLQTLPGSGLWTSPREMALSRLSGS